MMLMCVTRATRSLSCAWSVPSVPGSNEQLHLADGGGVSTGSKPATVRVGSASA